MLDNALRERDSDIRPSFDLIAAVLTHKYIVGAPQPVSSTSSVYNGHSLPVTVFQSVSAFRFTLLLLLLRTTRVRRRNCSRA